ncbi:NAD-dependent epimerase/dehydratase family protein [Variovorax boronicumulans]|uniref:NAD-dependent epimerase/dehydratase family protein n=1 Tax=Variovorax boronicumulans TaxID=436515 RepID=UPI00132FA574|nr:NAD-dependent epimerase/dehydratase family protein [Variovorax boronicumulans]
MKVLITGASGFVGKALVQYLIARDHQVVCAGRRTVSMHARAHFVPIANIDAHTDWQSALQDVEVVVHLAGRAHIQRESTHDPLRAFREVNVDGTLNLAQQAAMTGVQRFIFVSSIGVLGGQSSRPFTEVDTPAPIEPYAISKWEAEQRLTYLLKPSCTNFVIIRPPMVYGPGAPGNFNRLVSAIKKGVILPLGAIENRRTLVALDNLIDFISCCILHPAAANQVFLTGDAQDLSTTELICSLGAVLDRPARLLPVPMWLLEGLAFLVGRRAMLQKICGNLQIDISKARKLLGWVPPLSVDEGLRKVVAIL